MLSFDDMQALSRANLIVELTKPLTMPLLAIMALTAILFFFKSAQQHYVVFFYLFPVALAAVIYGTVVATVSAIIAALVAAYFLYDPIYSLYVSDPLDVGVLFIFAAIGLIEAKYITNLAGRLRTPDATC